MATSCIPECFFCIFPILSKFYFNDTEIFSVFFINFDGAIFDRYGVNVISNTVVVKNTSYVENGIGSIISIAVA